jgi:hypothetical protein
MRFRKSLSFQKMLALLRGGTTQNAKTAAWVVDFDNGSDGNTGDVTAPLQSVNEWTKRIGAILDPTTSMTLTVKGTRALTGDQPRDRIQVPQGAKLKIIGTPTVVTPGGAGVGANVTVVQRVDTAGSATPLKLTDTGLAAPAALVFDKAYGNKRIKISAGAHPGAILWPMKTPAANALNLSAPMIPTPSLGSFGQSVTTIATADSYIVEQLPEIPEFGLWFDVAPRVDSVEAVVIQDLAFPAANAMCVGSNYFYSSAQIAFYGCSFQAPLLTGGADLVNCRISDGGSVKSACSIYGGLIAGSLGFDGVAEGSIIDMMTALQGGSINCFSPETVIVAQLQAWDFASPGAIVAYQAAGAIFEPIFTTRLHVGASALAAGYYRTEGRAGFQYLTDTTGLQGQGSAGAAGVAQIGVPANAKSLAQLPFIDSTVSASGMIKL